MHLHGFWYHWIAQQCFVVPNKVSKKGLTAPPVCLFDLIDLFRVISLVLIGVMVKDHDILKEIGKTPITERKPAKNSNKKNT